LALPSALIINIFKSTPIICRRGTVFDATMGNGSDSDDYHSRSKSSRQLLPTFSHAEHWDKWKFKAQTKLNAKNYWYVLEEETPLNAILVDKTTDELQDQIDAVEFTANQIDQAALAAETVAATAAERPIVQPVPSQRVPVDLQRLELPQELKYVFTTIESTQRKFMKLSLNPPTANLWTSFKMLLLVMVSPLGMDFSTDTTRSLSLHSWLQFQSC
jgi:hypothetical protein